MEATRQFLKWNPLSDDHGATKKTDASAWLHGTRHEFTLIPGNAVKVVRVDDWLNGRLASPFPAVGKAHTAAYRGLRLKSNTCLLDPVVEQLVELPGRWDWNPGAEHEQVELKTVKPDDQDSVLAAQVVIAIRADIAVRENINDTLNCNTVTVVDKKGGNKNNTIPLDWAAALKAGRAEIDRLLGEPDELRSLAIKAPGDLDGKFQPIMCTADKTGLGQLVNYELILAPGARSGSPFRSSNKNYEFSPDRSGDLQSAYNHLRFVLFVEYRVLYELMFSEK